MCSSKRANEGLWTAVTGARTCLPPIRPGCIWLCDRCLYSPGRGRGGRCWNWPWAASRCPLPPVMMDLECAGTRRDWIVAFLRHAGRGACSRRDRISPTPRRKTAQAVTGRCRTHAARAGAVVRVRGHTLRDPRVTSCRGGLSSCSACAGDHEAGALRQARRPVAHIRSAGDSPDSRHASRVSDTAPSSRGSRESRCPCRVATSPCPPDLCTG